MKALSDQDRDKIVCRYLDRFERYGVDLRTLNPGKWNKLEIQHTVHASIGDLQDKTVLDIGCGLAHYYAFLRGRGLRVKYIGYDIVGAFITNNRERYSEALFELRDISRDDIVHEVDYAVMCQVFNNKYESVDNEGIVRDALAKSFAAARIGVSVDLRTSYVNFREDHIYYFSPERLFAFAKSLTPYVKLRHDYLPYDFTLFLYREGTLPWG